ncbi:MAG: type II toxin-antitoxin system RelE/ParE family toxin [Alphaproteobacteria bacterium]|nr:type II toxin-antitoxin system RelE/ParE family toxin [Alphaproteobacteria bacterium]
MRLEQRPTFRRIYKKLHANQKKDVNQAIKEIMSNPEIGVKKQGNLADVWVHKFLMVKQQTLLAYQYQDDVCILTLLSMGTHENFYRDLKTEV